ncbi:uncharacterized protein [Elaeis guineensis]|uniref:uncharacterized protein isoform X1 n=1 Tax=Elaeis guineensis var. tenera TaxID=51953 RepID=UPI003C6D5E63
MDPFSSPAPSNGSSGPSTEALMDQVKAQLAQAYAEEFLETVRSKCFSKCITKPGTGLSGSESSCISRCVERQTVRFAKSFLAFTTLAQYKGKLLHMLICEDQIWCFFHFNEEKLWLFLLCYCSLLTPVGYLVGCLSICYIVILLWAWIILYLHRFNLSFHTASGSSLYQKKKKGQLRCMLLYP